MLLKNDVNLHEFIKCNNILHFIMDLNLFKKYIKNLSDNFEKDNKHKKNQ